MIGVAAPLSGPSALLGQQISDGATIGAAAQTPAVTAQHCGRYLLCRGRRQGGAAFVEAKVSAVVGFLCTEAIEAALPILKDAGIPVITIGVRADSLTDRRFKTKWPVWRLGPRSDGGKDGRGRHIGPRMAQ